MLFDPKEHVAPLEVKKEFEKKQPVFERLLRFKKNNFLKRLGNVDRNAGRKLKMLLFNLLH
jgi:hypothetical protein